MTDLLYKWLWNLPRRKLTESCGSFSFTSYGRWKVRSDKANVSRTVTEHIFMAKPLWRYDQVTEFFMWCYKSCLNQINICSFVPYSPGIRFAENLTAASAKNAEFWLLKFLYNVAKDIVLQHLKLDFQNHWTFLILISLYITFQPVKWN